MTLARVRSQIPLPCPPICPLQFLPKSIEILLIAGDLQYAIKRPKDPPLSHNRFDVDTNDQIFLSTLSRERVNLCCRTDPAWKNARSEAHLQDFPMTHSIQLQLTISWDDTSAKLLSDFLAAAIGKALNTPQRESDLRAERRLQSSQNAIYAGQKPPQDQGLLIDVKQAAKLLEVSERTLWRMYTSGEMPPPIRIGRAVRWSRKALEAWIESGCPRVKNSQDAE